MSDTPTGDLPLAGMVVIVVYVTNDDLSEGAP